MQETKKKKNERKRRYEYKCKTLIYDGHRKKNKSIFKLKKKNNNNPKYTQSRIIASSKLSCATELIKMDGEKEIKLIIKFMS